MLFPSLPVILVLRESFKWYFIDVARLRTPCLRRNDIRLSSLRVTAGFVEEEDAAMITAPGLIRPPMTQLVLTCKRLWLVDDEPASNDTI